MELSQTLLINLEWEGPFGLKELPNLTNEESDYGIYQIYGKHPVYGNDVLIYIGKADRQTLGKRISQEDWINTNDSNNIKVYVGRLHGSKTPSLETWSKEIDLAERLLIYVHKPAYNSKSISSLAELEIQNIHILNWGDYRSLLPELSGLRWTSKLDKIEYELYKWTD
ncbi:hypothetical protein [Niallia sp. NCCP-28]|uniref:hypothetical protein n=1 Tax=Niallia sp. NCCP-28 TaxID=2934712 RepID=UPI002083CDE2|nr:hypothetical protein [Niallia sp. NCCP-28]GKU82592.1 hypothetical protein NCCP28_19880 [Niallia sp. NCCP-28]